MTMKWFHDISWGTPVSEIGWVWLALVIVLALLVGAIIEFLTELGRPIDPEPTPRIVTQRRPGQVTPPGVVGVQRGHMSTRRRTQIR
jgi:hypothetical protein